MELDHDFTVPVPLDQAWPVLLDVERIAPCMPGATLDTVDGDEFTGRLKVRLGAMTITYRGTARIASRDETTHTVTIEAAGKEARGSGTASATVQAQLRDDGERTRVTVHTKLNVTGRPAQFGRNILSEVGGKLIGRFADNLAVELSASPPVAEGVSGRAADGVSAREAPTPPAASQPAASTRDVGTPPNGSSARAHRASEPGGSATAIPAPEASTARPGDDAIDLLEFAGPSVAKRVIPVIAGLAVLLMLRRFLRRSRCLR